MALRSSVGAFRTERGRPSSKVCIAEEEEEEEEEEDMRDLEDVFWLPMLNLRMEIVF